MRDITIVQESSELRDDAFRWSLFTGTHDSISFRPSPRARRTMAGTVAITLLVQAPIAIEEPVVRLVVGVQLFLFAVWLTFYRRNEIRLTQTGLYLRLGWASRTVGWDQVAGLAATGRPSELVVIVDEGRGHTEAVPKMVAHLSFSFFFLGSPRESWLTTPQHIPQRFPGFIGEVILAWARLKGR